MKDSKSFGFRIDINLESFSDVWTVRPKQQEALSYEQDILTDLDYNLPIYQLNGAIR